MQPARPAASQRPKSSTGRILLYIGCGLGFAGFVMLLCCGGVIDWEYRNYKATSDPVQVRAALQRITDLEMPKGLVPAESSTNSRTDLERVEFSGTTSRSYLTLVTRPGQKLRHESTLKDSADRGAIAGGGRPEKPSQTITKNLTIRGQPAEFAIKRFAGYELVSGYFQGKTYPVFLEGRFEYNEFPAGTADQVVQAVQAGAPQ